MRKLTDTEHQIIKDWQQAEYAAKQCWKEVLAAGLYYESLGINTDKPDTAWRRPVTISTLGEEKSFLSGIGQPTLSVEGTGIRRRRLLSRLMTVNLNKGRGKRKRRRENET